MREITKVRGVAALGLLFFLAACGSRGPNSERAVREAIEAHLKTRSDLMMTNMTLEVESVKFGDRSAEAQVKYRSKDTSELAVNVRYTLQRAGDHWEVVSSSSANGMATSPPAPGSPAAKPPASAPGPLAPSPSH